MVKDSFSNIYCRYSKWVVILMIIFLQTLSGNHLFAQSADDDTDKPFISTLVDFSYINLELDFINYDTHEYIISQLGNGTLKLDKNDYLNMEYNISHSWINNSSYVVPGDFSFLYYHNFYSKKYLKSGFQGLSTKMKLVFPTGKSELLSGLDNWIVEPSVYYGWLLKNKKFFVVNHLRYHFSIGHLPQTIRTKPYIRFEPSFGYESHKFWTSITMDNRIYTDELSYIMFVKAKFGLKINKMTSIYTALTLQSYGSHIYNYYLNFGYFRKF